jgi:hypothetical protein
MRSPTVHLFIAENCIWHAAAGASSMTIRWNHKESYNSREHNFSIPIRNADESERPDFALSLADELLRKISVMAAK